MAAHISTLSLPRLLLVAKVRLTEDSYLLLIKGDNVGVDGALCSRPAGSSRGPQPPYPEEGQESGLTRLTPPLVRSQPAVSV